MPKVAIQLKDYKVAKGTNDQGINEPGHDTKLCVCWVSEDLYIFLGAPEYIPSNTSKPRPNPVNVLTYNTTIRGTKYGKTVTIATDAGDNAAYKKTYQMQIPSGYPIAFVADYLKERQADTSAPCKNKIRSVKVRNGNKIPIPVTT